MPVRQLSAYGYRGPDDLEWGEATHGPTWSEIEAAIRRLDANEFAGIVLHLNECQAGEPAKDYFAVTGGPHGYTFDYHVNGIDLYYVVADAIEPGDDVGIVQRDQGIWLPACHVCQNIEIVLKAAKWFVETEQPHPAVSWGAFALSDRGG